MKSGEGIASIFAALLGIAMVAVIVQSPNTSKVISATGTSFATAARAVMGK